MTQDEALKLALWHEAMAREPNRNQAKREKHEATAKFINEALAQPEQELVAIRYDYDGYGYQYIDSGTGSDWQTRVQGEPLYTHPVKDLEDIDINITWNENSMRDFGKDELNFARAILRKAQNK